MMANQMTYSKTSASSASDSKEILASEVMANQMRYPRTSASLASYIAETPRPLHGMTSQNKHESRGNYLSACFTATATLPAVLSRWLKCREEAFPKFS